MEFSGLSTYRSEGLGVNQTDNMVRVTVFATRNEWRRMLSAVQNIERRKTVAAKPAVQQPQGEICCMCKVPFGRKKKLVSNAVRFAH